MLNNFKHIIVGLGVSSGLCLSACSDKMHVFEGVEGPAAATPLIQPVKAKASSFSKGASSRLAILLTEDDSHWLGLASGLKTIGIPFRMTTDVDEALQHDVVMIYPHLSGRNMAPENLRLLRSHVDTGGTLIGTNVLGGGMADVFGFKTVSESKSRYLLRFQGGQEETQEFAEKGLAQIKIGSAQDQSANPGTNSYLNPVNPPLAVYENDGAAIISNTYGEGSAYALGIDLGQLLAKGYNRRQVDIAEYYANHYQPTLDALLILMENIYRAREPMGITLGTVPDGKSLSFILSHDIDFSESLRNAISYAEHQSDEDLAATYFIQTKYVEDYNDKIFMDDEGAELVQQLEALGAEVASHSVAHSNVMWDFDMGDGTESYPDYKPFVQTADRTRGATIMGELRVSKFLLDNFLTEQEVESFRPGFLSNPSQMPQGLASTGYKYSSSSTANVSLTHLPFQLTYGRGFDALTPVFEIPITVEDELKPAMYERLDDGIALARNIAKIEGVYVVLIHTDDVDKRLDFQKQIVDEVRPYAWMGSIRQFGDWWAARDQVSLDVSEMPDGAMQISLSAPTAIDGLTLELPASLDIIDTTLDMSALKTGDNRILIETLSGQHTITLRP